VLLNSWDVQVLRFVVFASYDNLTFRQTVEKP